MGFLSNIFRRKTEYYENFEKEAWEDEAPVSKKELDMRDPQAREAYVRSCLDEMRIASDEMDKLTNEYAVVTSYLTDMEEIESIPAKEKKELEAIAKHLHDLRKNHDAYVLKENAMTSREYNKIEAMEDEIAEILKKIEGEEEYKDLVKKDLSRVSRERKAYDYRKLELSHEIENSRGTAIIIMAAAAVLVVLLFCLQWLLQMDVKLGYYITIGLVAVALTYIYIKYMDSVSEKKRIDNTINELILLENKVKIRYVNNKNLLDYYYLKYDITSGKELRKSYDRFLIEREDRRKYETNEAVYLEEMARLVKNLRKYRVTDPDIWIHQAEALVDPREMVEIRHKLIGRRQKLRKQMEYNQTLAAEASDEIKEIMGKYPESRNAIMNMIDAFERGDYAAAGEDIKDNL